MELTKDQVMGLMFYHQNKIAGIAKYSGLLDYTTLDVLQGELDHYRKLRGCYERHIEAEQVAQR
jgi:hypothetical protein